MSSNKLNIFSNAWVDSNSQGIICQYTQTLKILLKYVSKFFIIPTLLWNWVHWLKNLKLIILLFTNLIFKFFGRPFTTLYYPLRDNWTAKQNRKTTAPPVYADVDRRTKIASLIIWVDKFKDMNNPVNKTL